YPLSRSSGCAAAGTRVDPAAASGGRPFLPPLARDIATRAGAQGGAAAGFVALASVPPARDHDAAVGARLSGRCGVAAGLLQSSHDHVCVFSRLVVARVTRAASILSSTRPPRSTGRPSSFQGRG